MTVHSNAGENHSGPGGKLRRRLSKRQLAITLVVTILVQEWLLSAWFGPNPAVGTLTVLVCLSLAVLYNSKREKGWHWGFSGSGFLPALWLAVLVTALLVGTVFLFAAELGPYPGRDDPWRDLLYLVPWVLAQQFVLQTVILREASESLPGNGVLVAAGVFSLLHFPNPFLVPATFISGLLWCWIFDRHPNLIPLSLSHGVCSLAVLAAIPRSVTGGLRVGYLFWS